jgi:hypothetical protein
MEEQKNNKRMLQVELDCNVKKVSITGLDADEKVVMRQDLDEDDLNRADGGRPKTPGRACKSLKKVWC